MKRYKHNGQYEIISRTRCINLFKKLLANLPGFAEQVFPQGIENSPYHSKYCFTAEMAYREYRELRAMYYKLSRRNSTAYLLDDMIPFLDFLKTFNPAPLDLQREVLNLFIEGMHEIFNHSSLVHDGKFNTYKRRYGLEFEDCMFKAVKTIFPEYTTGERWELFSVRTYQKVDMKPVYRYLFSLLKKEGLDYRYEVISSKIFDQLIDSLERIGAEFEIERILKEKKNPINQHYNTMQIANY